MRPVKSLCSGGGKALGERMSSGLEPVSTSVRSKAPSSSRSIPIRWPVSRYATVNVTGVSGEASLSFLPATNAVQLVKSGRLRALAVTSLARLPAMPELPTVSESGLKGYESSQWYGVLAPAGTPADVLNLLNSHIAKIMQVADTKQRLSGEGIVAVGSTREQFAAYIKSEIIKWAKVIKQSGARVD